jgi:hypothetical protein
VYFDVPIVDAGNSHLDIRDFTGILLMAIDQDECAEGSRPRWGNYYTPSDFLSRYSGSSQLLIMASISNLIKIAHAENRSLYFSKFS